MAEIMARTSMSEDDIMEILEDGPKSAAELRREIGCAPRTISYWLRRLRKAGRVKRVPSLLDMRRVLYAPVATEFN